MWSLTQFKEYLGGKPTGKKVKKQKESESKEAVPEDLNEPTKEETEEPAVVEEEEEEDYEAAGEAIWNSKWYP